LIRRLNRSITGLAPVNKTLAGKRGRQARPRRERLPAYGRGRPAVYDRANQARTALEDDCSE
jgi:hypothetical protein